MEKSGKPKRKSGVSRKRARNRLLSEKTGTLARIAPVSPPAINLERSVERLIAELSQVSNARLVGIWRNAVRLTEGKQKGAAIRAIKAIEKEWKRRGAAGVDPTDYFAWPTTDAPGGDGQLGLESLLKEGMLKYLEYQVGRTNGQAPSVRRAILRRVFEGELPPVFPPFYMAQWAAPGTAARLRKLAETIAALARNLKRRHDSRFEDAIADWEADLRFLFDEYYVGRFAFAWPSASI